MGQSRNIDVEERERKKISTHLDSHRTSPRLLPTTVRTRQTLFRPQPRSHAPSRACPRSSPDLPLMYQPLPYRTRTDSPDPRRATGPRRTRCRLVPSRPAAAVVAVVAGRSSLLRVAPIAPGVDREGGGSHKHHNSTTRPLLSTFPSKPGDSSPSAVLSVRPTLTDERTPSAYQRHCSVCKRKIRKGCRRARASEIPAHWAGRGLSKRRVSLLVPSCFPRNANGRPRSCARIEKG